MERVKGGQRARRRESEYGAVREVSAAAISGAIEIAVATLDHPGVRTVAISAREGMPSTTSPPDWARAAGAQTTTMRMHLAKIAQDRLLNTNTPQIGHADNLLDNVSSARLSLSSTTPLEPEARVGHLLFSRIQGHELLGLPNSPLAC